MAFTQTNLRLILGYSSLAQLGFITLGIFASTPPARARRARSCSRSTTGSWWRRCSSSSCCWPSAPGAPRTSATRRHRVPRAGAGHAGPDRRAGDAGDPRLGELRRRVLHPARRVQGKLALAIIASRAWCWRRSTCCAPTSARSTTASGRRSSRSSCRSRDGLVLVPLVVAILAFALYPQAALEPVRPRSGTTVRRGGGPMNALLAQATVKGPEIDLAAISPAIALAVGACVVLLVGLARSRVRARQRRAGADARDAGARPSGSASGSGTPTRRSSPTRW